MLTLKEIVDQAANALNAGFDHYFVNLASGEGKIDEAKFIGLLIQQTQPWLMFTEEGIESMMIESIYRDPVHLNLIYNLTLAFFSKLSLEESDYERYLNHMAFSFDINASKDSLSLMFKEYQDRLMGEDRVYTILKNNRPIVMLATMITHLDVSILVAAMTPPKNNVK